MKKQILCAVLSLSMTATMCSGFAVTASAAANTPQYQEKARIMEEIGRGLIAVKTERNDPNGVKEGVYLSWRLLGDEPLETQEYDIYKNGTLLTTTTGAKGTNYIDTTGTLTDTYKVVKAGASAAEVEAEKAVAPSSINRTARGSLVNNNTSEKNSYTYFDVPIQIPDDVERMGDGKTSTYKRGSNGNGANDASIGDLDGDGEYEIVLKWDPADSKDSAGADFTGNVYIDAYEIDANNGGYKWRIDLGKNVTAGAHYTQFMVYDFDGDGKSEVAMKTAPGSKDGLGNYVSEVGDTEAIRNVDNTKQFIGTEGRLKGKNPFTQYLTIFDGETGKALWTTEFIPYETSEDKYWGDGSAKYNRSERYLAAVAYLDGVHPSLIMCRGYYNDSVIRAYNWNGSELTMLWEHIGKASAKDKTLYGQGNHNLSISDIDNDGKDEIVYGSASLDHDGKTVMGNTGLGHGDAIHVNDFNNDGIQEVFSVKEDGEGYKKYAEDLRVASTGEHFWESGKLASTGDNGRGVMDNIDDNYAKTHPNALAIGWSSSFANAHDLNGDDLKETPKTSSRGMNNFLVYWDGDLGRELLDDNQLTKYHADTGVTTRFYDDGNGYFSGSSNNDSKHTPALVADLWGDWREEFILPVSENGVDTALRIFTSTIPTDYRLTTLMHDSQYRTAIAWQNVGYNQPPHTSYYVGSVALATDDSGNTLNYLAPKTKYTKVIYEATDKVAVTGVDIEQDSYTVEKGKTITINATVKPDDATRKAITWSSSNTNIATVENGIVKGINPGTTTITATTKDGGFTDTCEVTVISNSVSSVTLPDKIVEIGIGNSTKLKATVLPDNATDKTVEWTSANPAVATVSSDGTVTGVNFGKTTITVTTADGGKKAECIVKVKPIDVVDITGDNAFVFKDTNTDTNTTLNATATSAALTHADSPNGTIVEKKFEPVDKNNKAVLSFRVVTGGQKYDNATWNWIGHEYTLGLKFLDADGKNILTIEQPYLNKSATINTNEGILTSQVANDAKQVLTNTWNKVIDSAGAVQGSTKRWIVTMEFDYDNDKCNVTLVGTDGGWIEENAKYTKSFALNGAIFETMQMYTTKDGTGTLKATPSLSNVSYIMNTTAKGNSNTLYERGVNTDWSDADLTEWVQTNTDTAALALNEDKGGIWYNPKKPGTEFSAVKKIAGIKDGAVVTYDLDWLFGASIGRDGNFEYIQFGDKLRIGWTNGYNTYVSTDGGKTWSTDSIFKGSNTQFVKNVKVTFDTESNTIKSFTFDGKEISAYANCQLPDGTKYDSVTLGFTRNGAPPNWELPNGIVKINVSQFVEGEEEPDISAVKITSEKDNTVNVAYDLVDYDGDSMQLIGALYDEEGNLVEIKANDAVELDSSSNIKQGTDSITFERNLSDYDLKVFMWNTINEMIPIADAAEN